MKRRLIIAIILITVLSIPFLGESAVANNSQYRVVARVGSTFKIKMSACTDGHYCWYLARQSKTGTVKLKSIYYIFPPPPIYGGPTTQVFKFKAVTRGAVRLTFVYKMWSYSPVVKNITWTVVVLPRRP